MFISSCICRVVLVMGVLAVSWSAQALDPRRDPEQYVQRRWHIDDGLPMGSLNEVVQTTDGYLWMSTEEGLVRFDGVQFELYDSYTTNDAVADNVNVVVPDDKGGLWVGHGRGLSHYAAHRWTRYGKEEGLLHDHVKAILVESSERLWVGTQTGGLYVLEGGKFSRVRRGSGLKSSKITALFKDNKGVFWVGTDQGLFKSKNGKTFKSILEKDGLPNAQINTIAQPLPNEIWVGTNGGLAVIKNSKIETYTPADGLAGNHVAGIFKDSDGTVVIGDYFRGLASYRDGRFSNISERVKLTEGVVGFHEDHERNLWLATKNNGLVRFHDGKILTFNPTPGKAFPPTLGIYGEPDGTMWFGSYNGLTRYQNGEYRVISKDQGLWSHYVLAISPARDGGLWLGTAGSGFGHFDKENTFRVYTKEDGLPDERVRSLYETEDGTLWIGTVGGLVRFKDNEFEMFTTAHGMPHNRVTMMLPNPDGSLWLATDGGISLFNGKTFRNVSLGEDGPSNQTFTIYRDKKGYLWIGTYNGVVVYRDGQLKRIRKKDGLSENKASTITEDDDGYFWMSTNRGIFRVLRQELLDFANGNISRVHSEKFDTSDGMITKECNGGFQQAAWKTTDGHIYFATEAGAALYSSEFMAKNEVPPPMLIDSVLVDGKPIEGNLELAPGMERFLFNYTAMSFVAPETVQFEYKLEGFDRDWVKAGTDRSALYTNLGDGDYKFVVRAANNDGVWNTQGASFSFAIAPRFFETWWFLLLSVLIVVSSIVTFVRLRTAAHRKRDLALNQITWERTREVLEGQVGAIRNVAGDLSAVGDSIRKLMSNLLSSSEQVSAAVSETAATVEQMERSSKLAETNAAQIVSAAATISVRAKNGLESVSRSTEVMTQIKQDSVDIAQANTAISLGLTDLEGVTMMVKEISDQSKILSVNAAIEAKKAGKAGIGFVVVANHMKDLAVQSKSSATQINDSLRAVISSFSAVTGTVKKGGENTEVGVTAIAHSGRIVEDLSSEMGANSELAKQISTTIDQQLLGLKYIISAVDEIRVAVKDNTGIGMDVIREAGSLGSSIETLTTLIDEWRTPEFYQQQASAKRK